MRVLALLLGLTAMSAPPSAQQSVPLRTHLSAASGGGSDGVAFRFAAGVERGAYAVTARYVADGLWADGTTVQQQAWEVGLLGSLAAHVAKRARVRAGAGIGYSSIDVGQPASDPSSRPSSTAYAFTLPFEAELELRATGWLAVTLGGYYSVEVGRSHVDTGGVPRTTSLDHGGLLVGTRVLL